MRISDSHLDTFHAFPHAVAEFLYKHYQERSPTLISAHAKGVECVRRSEQQRLRGNERNMKINNEKACPMSM